MSDVYQVSVNYTMRRTFYIRAYSPEEAKDFVGAELSDYEEFADSLDSEIVVTGCERIERPAPEPIYDATEEDEDYARREYESEQAAESAWLRAAENRPETAEERREREYAEELRWLAGYEDEAAEREAALDSQEPGALDNAMEWPDDDFMTL